MKKIEAELAVEDSELQTLQTSHATLLDLINTLQSQSLGISVSDSNGDKGSGSLSAQLMESQRVVLACEGDIKKEEINVSHLKKQIKQKQQEAKESENEFKMIKKDFDKKNTDIANLKVKLNSLDFDSVEFKRLGEKKEEIQLELNNLIEKMEPLTSEIGALLQVY